MTLAPNIPLSAPIGNLAAKAWRRVLAAEGFAIENLVQIDTQTADPKEVVRRRRSIGKAGLAVILGSRGWKSGAGW